MKQILLTALLMPFFLLGSAQSALNVLDISTFKLPNMSRSTLELTGRLSGNTTNSEYDKTTNSGVEEIKGDNINGGATINYLLYTNSDKLQQLFRVSSTINSSFEKETTTNPDYKNKRNMYNPRLSLDINSRYYKTANFFIGTTFGLLGDIYHSKNTLEAIYISEKSTNNYNTTAYVTVKTGIGRIEQVQDARKALLILEELQKEGFLDRQVTTEDAYQLATTLSRLNNKRFLDTRYIQGYHLAAIDTFLRSQELISNKEIRYYNTLNYMWRYGNNQIRESGLRYEVAATPIIDYTEKNIINKTIGNSYENSYGSFNDSQSKQLTDEIDLGIIYGVNLVLERPLDVYWQQSTYASANLFNTISDYSKNDNERTSGYILSAKHEYGFYPNIRTNFRMGINASYIKHKTKEEDSNTNLKTFEGNGYGNIYYYLSENVQLRFTASIGYDWSSGSNVYRIITPSVGSEINNFTHNYLNSRDNSHLNKQFNTQFSITLTYYIF